MGQQISAEGNKPLALQVRGIHHSFGNVQVLQAVNFDLKEGEIHSLVGENGAGKSTLMKIVFGLLRPDQGKVFLGNRELEFLERCPEIGMVHQHLMLAAEMSPLDHVMMENSHAAFGLSPLPRKKILAELEALSRETAMPVPWEKKVSELSVGIAQRVEILRLLYAHARILIFDEPTAVLSPSETQDLLKRLLHFKKRGHSIILISHKLKEVLQVSDRITVIRKGKTVDTRANADWTVSSLGEAMVGRPLKTTVANPRPRQFQGVLALEMKRAATGLQIEIEKGEILGVAGVEGNGQEWLVEAVLRPKIELQENDAVILRDSHGEQTSLRELSTGAIRALGVGFLADDRHSKSVLLNSDLTSNFILGGNDLWSRHGLLHLNHARAQLLKSKNDFSIQFELPEQNMGELSGGNQQKIVVARETQRDLVLLVAHQPTRGVDIGAMEQIHQKLLRLRDQGTAILLISSDLDELMQISDRMIALYNGSITGNWTREEISADANVVAKIGAAMGGRTS